MASPVNHRFLGIVITGEIILRHMDRKSQILIPQVLLAQGIRILFGMAGYKDLAALLVHYRIDTSLLGRSQDL